MTEAEKRALRKMATEILWIVDDVWKKNRDELECSLDDVFKAVEIAVLNKKTS